MPEAIGYLITALCAIILLLIGGIFRLFRIKAVFLKVVNSTKPTAGKG